MYKNTERIEIHIRSIYTYIIYWYHTSKFYLAPDEDVERIAVLGVTRAGHGVERPNFQRVLVHHEKVRLVLVGHQVTQLLLVLRRQVAVRVGCKKRTTVKDDIDTNSWGECLESKE